ncbi:MAG TPA: 3-isopropylmalate dehydratase small subunit [Atribacteraceae bacterium]|nr:3-isopropylmalate dehydratase small subunit [Atribacteraceae bacterium]
MQIRGRVIRYGDNVDTDVIIPARYLTATDPLELAKHCLEDLDPNFIKKVTGPTIMVAGKNFGCGSSREHAPLAIKASGVQAVVAASFARIFYRNALNIGLPIFESQDAATGIREGDEMIIDTQAGTITDLTSGAIFTAQPLPPFLQEMISRGGLMNYVKDTLRERKQKH